MRLWSIHPKYLDSKGLVALWRESLLAKKVLEGKTKGYKNHPQLNRFKNKDRPILCLKSYLVEIWNEAMCRGHHFNSKLIGFTKEFREFIPDDLICVTQGQLEYEFSHLQKKLGNRDLKRYNDNYNLRVDEEIEPHPIFKIVNGPIEKWERVKNDG